MQNRNNGRWGFKVAVAAVMAAVVGLVLPNSASAQTCSTPTTAGCYTLCEGGECDNATACTADLGTPGGEAVFLGNTDELDHVAQTDIQLVIIQGSGAFCRNNGHCTPPQICHPTAFTCGNPCPPACAGGQVCDGVPGVCIGAAAKLDALNAVRQILAKTTIDPVKIKGVDTIQQAIAAINADFTLKGNPIPVHIVGHGRPGSIKVGEDRLNLDTPAGQAAFAKFTAAVNGKVSKLTLVGCKTGAGAAGQELKAHLSKLLSDIEVKAWTGTIWPLGHFFSDGSTVPPSLANKYYTDGIKKSVTGTGACSLPPPKAPNCACDVTEYTCTGVYGGTYLGNDSVCPAPGICVPALTEWGLVVMALLVVTAATIVVMRRRVVTA